MALPPPLFPDPKSYPQWGTDQARQIAKANNGGQKNALIQKGYLDWFPSLQAAQNSLKKVGISIPNPLSGVDAIADDIGKAGAWAGKKSNWVRVLKVGIGVLLIIAGLLHLTKGEDQIVKTAAKVAGTAAIA